MSSVTLSAATRQNLLSLQDTANLLSTTQNRLSTGKKVNSALDNPTNFFTSQSLSARSSDLTSLLDGISNGIQVIQAANQGITSMQKLLDSAKSTLTQALSDKSSTASAAPATSAKLTGLTAVSTVDLSGAGKANFSITVNGGTKTDIVLDQDTLKSAAKDLTKVSGSELVSAINNQFNASADTKGLVQASLDSSGRIQFETIGANGTGATAEIKIEASATAGDTDIGFGASVATTDALGTAAGAGDPNSTRAKLATQFSDLLEQISQQAKDSSYNGVNLLYRAGGDASQNTLKVLFNEDGSSNLEVKGVKFDADGLGLTAATDGFASDTTIQSKLDAVNAATSQLRAQASGFGSNLSVVQNRQDFTKNLVNILDTGASNLTSADLNEEAANSQALSTRNSLAISALSLANQSQQGILQLLR